MPRFTIRNILSATFFLCLWLVTARSFPHQSQSGVGIAIFIFSWFYFIAGPFTVIGALAGQTMLGFVFGMMVAVGLSFVTLIVGYISMPPGTIIGWQPIAVAVTSAIVVLASLYRLIRRKFQ